MPRTAPQEGPIFNNDGHVHDDVLVALVRDPPSLLGSGDGKLTWEQFLEACKHVVSEDDECEQCLSTAATMCHITYDAAADQIGAITQSEKH